MNQADKQVIGASTNDGQDYQDRQAAWFARAGKSDRSYTTLGPKWSESAKKTGHQQDDLPYSKSISLSDKIKAIIASETTSSAEAIAALEDVLHQLKNNQVPNSKESHSEKPAPGSYLGWNSQPNPGLELPVVAPALYAEQSGTKKDAISFLSEIWGDYIKAGVLFQDDLGRLDAKLISAVYSRCNYIDIPARSVLPPARIERLHNASAEELLAKRRELDRLRKANRRTGVAVEAEQSDNVSAEELLAKRRELNRLRMANRRAAQRSTGKERTYGPAG